MIYPLFGENYLWYESKFNEMRKDLVNAHNELVELIDKTTNELKENESTKMEKC